MNPVLNQEAVLTAGRPARIGVVAALPGELGPLVRGWTRAGQVYIGQRTLQNGTTVTIYACAAGMGASAATRAFAHVAAASGGLDAIVSYGWAGALSCGVKPPDVYLVHEVVDSGTGERFGTAAPQSAATLRLVTLDHVARATEKRALAQRYQAVLVDMEAATVGRLAVAHGIPFVCVKGISDGYTDVLPDFNRFLSSDGQLRLPACIAYALLRPRYWASLAKLGSNSRRAAANLSAELSKHLSSCQLNAGIAIL